MLATKIEHSCHFVSSKNISVVNRLSDPPGDRAIPQNAPLLSYDQCQVERLDGVLRILIILRTRQVQSCEFWGPSRV